MEGNMMRWGRWLGCVMLVASSSGIGCAAEAASQGVRAEFVELRKQLPVDQKAALRTKGRAASPVVERP